MDLYWPGDERAGGLMSDGALLDAMVAVEAAWLAALVDSGIAPATAAAPLAGLVGVDDLPAVTTGAESGGNPVLGLVDLLRERARHPESARWLHRGLTSQDVLDSALMLCARDAVARVRGDLRAQVDRLAALVEEHRTTAMVARTLTQHAVPTTFGLKAATWLTGVLDSYDELGALVLPAQVGGAAGTLAAVVELAAGDADPVRLALSLAEDLADRLGLARALPWHTHRAPSTRICDALVRTTDAWGRIAADVLVLGRPEVGELSEGVGGGSSTMPHKANPVLSVLVRRAALSAPQLAATLHLAAAEQVDERADGGWHAEWATLRTLLRRTVTAGSQTTDLLDGLQVHADRMAATLERSRDDVHAEQRTMAGLAGREPDGPYVGAAPALVEVPLARAYTILEEAR